MKTGIRNLWYSAAANLLSYIYHHLRTVLVEEIHQLRTFTGLVEEHNIIRVSYPGLMAESPKSNHFTTVLCVLACILNNYIVSCN